MPIVGVLLRPSQAPQSLHGQCHRQGRLKSPHARHAGTVCAWSDAPPPNRNADAVKTSGGEKQKSPEPFGSGLLLSMVGVAGFELATPCTPCKCATRLRYTPTRLILYAEKAQFRESSARISNNSWRTALESREKPAATIERSRALSTSMLGGSASCGREASSDPTTSRAACASSCRRLRAPLMVKPWSYSRSRMRRIISTSWCW